MRHRTKQFPIAPWAITRSVGGSVLAIGVAWAAFTAQGCGATVGTTDPIGTTDNSADQALRAVNSCQTQARACFADGGGTACEEQLRACLGSLVPDAGHGGGPDDDAEPPEPPESDGGRPPIPDASHPATPDPAAAVLACVHTLRACLGSATKPSTCAENAKACLLAARDVGRD
jgi:hypothetical protein